MRYGINVGCGKKLKISTKETKWYNLDTHKRNGADIIYHLPTLLPFKNNSLDIVYSSHVLEDFTADVQRKIMLDFLRVLKPGGTLHLKMPHVSNKCFVGSVYHMKPAVSGTFNALVKGYEEDNYSEPERFSEYLLKRINFHKEPKLLWILYGWWNEPLANKFHSIYEFSIWSNLFPAHEIELIIKK